MQMPLILQGDSLKRLLQGAFVGFLATVVIGFNWGGWTLGSTAKEMAGKSASSAVIAALAPICVDKFQRAAGAQSSPSVWQRPASLRWRAPVAANRWRHPAPHAVRTFP